MNQLRTVVEAWPALLTEEMSARYLSIEPASFRRVAVRLQVHPVELENECRWRKSDLDQMIRRLPTRLEMPDSTRGSGASRFTQADIERIVDGVARRLEGAVSTPQRAMVSVNEACTLLGIARTTVYNLINEGQLQPRHIGRRTLIPMSQIQAILDGGLSE